MGRQAATAVLAPSLLLLLLLRVEGAPLDAQGKGADDRALESIQQAKDIAAATAPKAGGERKEQGGVSDVVQKSEAPQPPVSSDVYISKAFFINLEADVKRRAHTEGELREAGVNFARVPAVTPQDVLSFARSDLYPLGLASNVKDPDSREVRSMACDLSHRIVYDLIAREKDGLYLLLEDDVVFEPHWKEKFSAAWPLLPSNWTIARLGFWGDANPQDLVNEEWYVSDRHGTGWNDKGPNYFYGAHAILVTPSRAKRMLELMKQYTLSFADTFTASSVVPGSYVMSKGAITVSSNFTSSRETGQPSLALKGVAVVKAPP